MTLTSSLRDRVAGPVVAPGEAGYEDARRVCNFMIDKHPAVIVRGTGARGIQAVVAHATGVAGLTLGAGIGYLARAHGLPCRTATSAEHQPAMVAAGGIEWPPALVAASGG